MSFSREELISELKALQKKYIDLAWYSRRTEEDRFNHNMLRMKEVEQKFPEEISDYAEGEGDGSLWYAGFFDGMLAATHLYLGLLSDERRERQEAYHFFTIMDL